MNLNIRFDYRKLRIVSIIYLALIIMLELLLTSVSYMIQKLNNRLMDDAAYVFLFLGINTMSMFLSQMILLILSIKQRFSALNNLIETSSALIGNQQLKMISQIHLKLTEIIETMNETYCLIYMMKLAAAFGMFNLFLFTIKSLIFNFSQEFFFFFIVRIITNSYTFGLTFMVIVAAGITTKEANRTIRILFDALHNLKKSFEWKTEMTSFVQQITLSQTKFSCGLFNYDWKLCFKVIQLFIYKRTERQF